MIRVIIPTATPRSISRRVTAKEYIVLFAGHPVVIAGVGYRIDAIGEAHIDNALVDICDTTGKMALTASFALSSVAIFLLLFFV